MTKVISVENLSKQYDLGVIGTGTLSRDLNRWWARVRGLPDPYTRIGQKDVFERLGESILALDDVSFTVQQGEALGIIGRNGAGKSTLLKILSRVTAPTSGVVKVKGRIGSLLEVGTGFHPELTGRENVFLNGAILGMKKAEVNRKFDEIVVFSGVEKFIDTPVKRYSSGMYVRLAFAVAAHLDPDILIVDEVLAVGDVEFQKKCLGKMDDVASGGRTVLFVSHNLDAVKQLCDYSLLLHDGQIKEQGETESIIANYVHEESAGTYKSPETTGEFAHISKIWFTNNEGFITEHFTPGERVIVNIVLNNLQHTEYFIDLAFFTKGNIRLWSFSHKEINIPPVRKFPKSIVKYSFLLPEINVSEVFIHAGLHKKGVSHPYYVDHIKEGLRFIVNKDLKISDFKNESILTCSVDFQETTNE